MAAPCNTTRKECTAEEVFGALASPPCAMITNPINYNAEQLIYDSAFKDLINSRGIPVNYYINTFNIETADLLYGEEPLAKFYGPIPLMMYVELQEDAISLASFGFESDDSFTGFVHIDTFMETMSGTNFNIYTDNGAVLTAADIFDLLKIDTPHLSNNQDVEPKAGDLIELAILGCDRPGNRGAKIFQVTEEDDQDLSSMNPMLGHYTWRLRAKRYEHSFEPGAPLITRAPQEAGNEQVYDNEFTGTTTTNIWIAPELWDSPELWGESYRSPDKSYEHDVDVNSVEEVFDMSGNPTDIYGEYY